MGSYRASCTEPSVFRGECVGSCGTYIGFLQGSIHTAISFQRGVCRFLQSLHWAAAGFHAQRLTAEIQSGPQDEVKKRCTNNPLRSDSDGSECKYIFLRLNTRKPFENSPSGQGWDSKFFMLGGGRPLRMWHASLRSP